MQIIGTLLHRRHPSAPAWSLTWLGTRKAEMPKQPFNIWSRPRRGLILPQSKAGMVQGAPLLPPPLKTHSKKASGIWHSGVLCATKVLWGASPKSRSTPFSGAHEMPRCISRRPSVRGKNPGRWSGNERGDRVGTRDGLVRRAVSCASPSGRLQGHPVARTTLHRFGVPCAQAAPQGSGWIVNKKRSLRAKQNLFKQVPVCVHTRSATYTKKHIRMRPPVTDNVL